MAAAALATFGLLWLLLHVPLYQEGAAWGYDYRAYHEAAIRLVDTGSLYQAETLGGPFRPGPYGLYMYAPPLGVALVPIAALPVDVATMVWFIFHIVALALACGIMPVRPTVRLAVFGVAALSYATTRDLLLGNVSILLLLPLAIAWRRLDEPLGAIAQAVAVSIRPMLGVLILWQALRSRWVAVAWTLAAGIVLVALTLPMVGINGYLDYFTMLRNVGGATGVLNNHDLSSLALALGFAEPIPTLLLLAGYATAVAAVVLSLRRDPEVGFVVSVTASLLLSPLLWDHYLAMLVLPTALLVERGRPMALMMPLLAWLPGELFPWLVVLAMLLPFWTPDAGPGPAERQKGTDRASPTIVPIPSGIATVGRGKSMAVRL